MNEIFAPADQWIMPPVPLLDVGFDDDDIYLPEPHEIVPFGRIEIEKTY